MMDDCNDLLEYIAHVDSAGGVSKIDRLYEHAICDCIERLEGGVKSEPLGFDEKLQSLWSTMRTTAVHSYHGLELSEVWEPLSRGARALLGVVDGKLR